MFNGLVEVMAPLGIGVIKPPHCRLRRFLEPA